MKGEGFFPDFDPIFGLQVDNAQASMRYRHRPPELKFGPSCNDRIGPVAIMFLVEWWKCVGPYPLVVHLVPRAAGPWRKRLGRPPKDADMRIDHAEVWLNVPDFSARSDETRRARISTFATSVNVESKADHALAEPDDFTVWQVTSTIARYLIHHSSHNASIAFPVYAKNIGSADMRLGLPLRQSKAWAYCNEVKSAPGATTAMRSIVNTAGHNLRACIDDAAVRRDDYAHFEIDLRPAKEVWTLYDKLRDMNLTPQKLSWAAVERFRKFRGDPNAIDAEAFLLACAHEQIGWLQHPALTSL